MIPTQTPGLRTKTKQKLKAAIKRLCERAHADEQIMQEGQVDEVFLDGLPSDDALENGHAFLLHFEDAETGPS